MSIQSISRHVNAAALFAQKYLFVTINKFVVTTEVRQHVSKGSIDQGIIKYIVQNSNMTCVYSTCNPNDNGSVGNFIYPVTQVMLAHND